jgi:hypothetical protein
MRIRPSALALIAILAAGPMLVACDESEQGRVLRYEKGTYLGKPDTALSDQTLKALRHRATRQGGG